MTPQQLKEAQEAQQRQWELLSRLPRGHPDVVTTSLLPQNPDHRA